MSDGISAQGTYLTVGNGASPEVFTEIPECKSIPGPSGTSDEIDMTHLRSSGGYKEYLQSFKDNDDIALECNYIPGDPVQAGLSADYHAGTILNFVKHYPDGATDAFTAYIKADGRPSAMGEGQKYNVTLRVTGAPVFTPS